MASTSGVASGKRCKNPPSSSAGVYHTTYKQSKRSNTTTKSPHAKCQRLREQPADDVFFSSEDDGEVFDDAPHTRADIPKIVEAG